MKQKQEVKAFFDNIEHGLEFAKHLIHIEFNTYVVSKNGSITINAERDGDMIPYAIPMNEKESKQ